MWTRIWLLLSVMAALVLSAGAVEAQSSMRFEKFVVEKGQYPWTVWHEKCESDYTWAEFWRATARQSRLSVALDSFRHLPAGYTLSVPVCSNAVAASAATAQPVATQAAVDSLMVQHATMQATLDSLQSEVADVTAWQAVETDAGHHTYLYIIVIVTLAILSLILALLLFLTLASVRRHVQLADRELHGRPIIHEETVFAGDDPISDPPTTQRELYLEFFRGAAPLYWLVTIIPSWLLPRYEPPTPFLLRNYHK